MSANQHDFRSVATWTEEPLSAASMSVSICPNCGSLIVHLHARDDSIFAQGHLLASNWEDFVENIEEAMGEPSKAGLTQ
jgi:hypothetical protein